MLMNLDLTFSQVRHITIKLSNLFFVILLLKNVFKIFSFPEQSFTLQTDTEQFLKNYILWRLMERVPFLNVTEFQRQLPFWYLFLCCSSFPLDNLKSTLVLHSVLRCLGSPLHIIVPVSSAIHRTILWLFLGQVHQRKTWMKIWFSHTFL